ncbi:GIY-YIG nuclease family protein [Sulfuracidifex tepidarius]|uniref:GIY-YIG domain-containing protein n=1 Tax=Sulfuracidifex tepidarius TaxID=1294262 RepID=A0A510DZW3_9CREN|nr:DUF123 domain-containing protein [Sulfuracidifex tepidarius]BBG22998.1 hypothetical protein IC006_0282 [Sulfuracidifex tepidarius]BBG25759.1 hypothetical protein IC007_0264 [Sulfuracidifex tepidarius]
MKGYLILFLCKEGVLKSRTKEFRISNGLYCYVGSCGRNCAKRISRHLSSEKNKFWHVDFLSQLCVPVLALVIEKHEREIARIMRKFPSISGFGNSDDNENESHLFLVSSFRDVLIPLTSLVGNSS